MVKSRRLNPKRRGQPSQTGLSRLELPSTHGTEIKPEIQFIAEIPAIVCRTDNKIVVIKQVLHTIPNLVIAFIGVGVCPYIKAFFLNLGSIAKLTHFLSFLSLTNT
jgi:hypothetical protein